MYVVQKWPLNHQDLLVNVVMVKNKFLKVYISLQQWYFKCITSTKTITLTWILVGKGKKRVIITTITILIT